MKIIKEGTVPEAHAKCEICGCEFLYDRRDVEKISATEYLIECPCCMEKREINYDSKVTLKIF